MASQTGTELPSEYDTLQIGIALYDPETGTVLDANDRLETILGYTTEQLRDRSIEEYTANTYPHSTAEFHDRLRASATGTPQQFTWRVKRADGELIWARLYLSRHRLAGRHYVRAEVQDITDYYETHHRAELFWRVLRHNLRNEATVILGHTNQITAQAETDPVQDAAETIRTRIENLATIAESVKEIEQAVATTETRRVRRHATAAVADVVDTIRTEHPAGEIAIHEHEAMGIRIDSAFTHALSHALENAIVHSDEPAPVVDIHVGSSPNTGRVELCITDQNQPIPDDELDALFSPSETTNTSHGSGVGLFVMKWCVESLGGEIKFERDPSGNAVYFYLPPKPLPTAER